MNSLIFVFCLLAPTTLIAKSTDEFQALIVSADTSFVASEKSLEFASLDAKRLARALVTAGRVPAGRVTSLLNPSMAEFNRTVLDLSKESSQKFMFYFSGHSDENGLHLKDGAVTKSKFHELLGRISSKVKIVILDSCFSGALKSKGVKKEKPIELVQYDVDEPTGSVILTSSSERELSYESERFRGSIFTYHLVSGIYGQADANSDGLVTIDELYQYVYSQTKFQSMVSGGRVQSPEFESKLTGQGALVVSYPARINGQLALASELQGELTFSSPKGINFFKFIKNRGEEKVLSLPRGNYEVTVVEEGRIGTGQVEVVEQETHEMVGNALVWKKRETPSVRAKGAQNQFLFGLQLGAHPAFHGDEEDAGMAEFFALSPSTPALGGRWRLAIHVGGESHNVRGTTRKSEYSRLTIGTEANFTGWSTWNNEWLVGLRAGTLTNPNPLPNAAAIQSLTHLSFGSRFFPEAWKLNWDFQIGFENIKAPTNAGVGVTTFSFALSY